MAQFVYRGTASKEQIKKDLREAQKSKEAVIRKDYSKTESKPKDVIVKVAGSEETRQAVVEHVKEREASPVKVSQKFHAKYQAQRTQESVKAHKRYVEEGIQKQKEEDKKKFVKIKTATKTPGVKEAIIEHVKEREKEPVGVSEKLYDKYKFKLKAVESQEKLKRAIQLGGAVVQKQAYDIGSVGVAGIVTIATVGTGTVLLSGVSKAYPVATKVVAGGLTGAFGYRTYREYKKAETDWDKLIVTARTGATVVGAMIGYDIGKYLVTPTITTEIKGIKSKVITRPNVKVKSVISKGQVIVKTSTKLRDILHLKPKEVRTYAIDSKGYILSAGDKIGYVDVEKGIFLQKGQSLGVHKGTFVSKKESIPFKILEKSTPHAKHISTKGIAVIKKKTFTLRAKTQPILHKKTYTHYGIKEGTWAKGKGVALGEGITKKGKTIVAPEGSWVQEDYTSLSRARGIHEFKRLIKIQPYSVPMESPPPLATGHIVRTILKPPSPKVGMGESSHFITGLATTLVNKPQPAIPFFIAPSPKIESKKITGDSLNILEIKKIEGTSITEPMPDTIVEQPEIVKPIKKLRGGTKHITIQQPVEETILKTTPITAQPPSYSPPIVFAPPPFLIPKKFLEEPALSFEGGVGLLIRREGVFRKVGEYRTEREALFRGKHIISHTAGASFKLDEPLDLDPFGSGILSREQFRESTKEAGVFIEKKEKRIKSPGELMEITFKGIEALKRKASKKKSIFNVFGG